jgi:ATP-binding cassette, subfamily B, heavy metal transporter
MKIYELVILELRKRIVSIGIVLCLILSGKLLFIALPFFLKAAVDALIYEPSWATGLNIYPPLIVAAYAATFFLASILEEIKEYLSEKTIHPSIAEVAKKLFTSILDLPISFHLDSKTGVVMREFDRGVRSLQSLSSLLLYTAIPLFIEIIAVISIFFVSYSIKYGAIIALGIAIHITVTLLLTPSLVSARQDLNKSDSELNGFVTESIINFESLKLFSNSKRESININALFEIYLEKVTRFQFLHSKLKSIQRTIIAVTLGFLMWEAATDVMYGVITPGDFVLINAFALQVLLPISAMGILWKEFNQNLADVRSLNFIAEITNENSETKSSEEKLVNPPKIEFVNVSYLYPNGKLALDKISFSLLPGTTTALVGANGAGKTTVLRLLMGLIEPTTGSILIDDRPMTGKDLASLRSSMGIVPQFVSLFHGTISYNLTYGLEDHTIEKAREVARLVNLEREIETNFPEGFNTQVGERGQKLSGGERQKIGLARALINNPKIVILDEASSSLDNSSERSFIASTLKRTGHQTTLMITHSLDGLDNAVNILVLSNGVLMQNNLKK